MIPGYKIVQEIFRSRKRIIYRGQREEDKRPVIIKTLVDDFPAAADLASLKHEYEILKNLHIDGIAKAYALERHQKGLALILEDIDGEPLRNLIDSAQPLPHAPFVRRNSTAGVDLRAFLHIAIPLSAAIAELHKNHIIHKDINPKNITLNLKTQKVQLIDFSIASRLPREDQKISHPNLLEGTLAYISPEQTGRMNRAVDYRTDFYSLGVTFYEMLTGQLPFYSPDPLELVHWHIAKNPQPPIEVHPEIPQTISDMVMKLLSKTAENRYSSGFGLKADLERCLSQLQSRGQIDLFVPGQHEVSDRFNIPQKLYGREEEIARLMAAFDRVCQGTVEMMMVSGYSGIGKTSLIQEIHKPIVRQKGYFISGKFDQLNRVVPYSAMIQAFQELVRQLLMESAKGIQLWKEKLLEALGPNGQVIIDVIPEVELIIGTQPAVPQLGPTESQNRFQLVFQKFLDVFAKAAHPLVIFLDDLQWVDSASLKLLQTLTTNPDIRYLFVIGAYRDNEVSANHPLILTLAELQKAGAKLSHISLTPLSITHLNQLIADTLKCKEDRSAPLAELVMRKTDGNPFFVIQFLQSLYQENLLEFNYSRGQWQFDLDRIESRGMTDNVVELMAGKIQKLSDQTQHILKLAACIGNRFDLNTLAIISEKSVGQTAGGLWEALQEGLVLPTDNIYDVSFEDSQEIPSDFTVSYKFLHDRVQQAAYELIPESQKQAVHRNVGQLMLEKTNAVEREEKLFDIVNHLNFGRELLADPQERRELAGLNLAAGKKAKSSTAYKTALSYFQVGRELLSEHCWTADYDFTFALYLELAECEYLCGNFDKAEEYFALLLSHAQSKREKTLIYNLRIIQYENISQYSQAVEAGKEGLQLLGIVFPDAEIEKRAAFAAEMEAIQIKLGDKKIEDLIHLPVMTDQDIKMSMKLLMTMWAPAYIAGDFTLYILIAATMVRLSLEYGNVEESAYGYVIHAVTVGSFVGDYASSYEFGRLALAVNEKFHDRKLRAKIHHMFSCFINFWRMPIQTCFPHAKEAYQSGLETGDFAYATYGIFHESWYGLLTGNELSNFHKEYNSNVSFLQQIKNYSFADAQQVILHWGLNLQGLTESTLSLSDSTFRERDYQETYGGDPFFETFYFVTKLHILFTFEHYVEAKAAAQKAEGVIHALAGTLWQVLLCFYHALTLTALSAFATEEERLEYWEKLGEWQAKMKIWADNCPANFQHHYLLLSAEMAKIAGHVVEAMHLYEEAIRAAQESAVIQNEALANELYARFWLQRNNEKIAKLYMAEARYGYTQWGATAKVKDLEERYPQLFTRDSAGSTVPADALAGMAGTLFTTRAQSGALDIFTVVKAAQAISSEIVLEKLLQKLMKIVIENAGAQRGLLIQEKEGKAFVPAEGSVDNLAVKGLQVIPIESSRSFSPAIANYVRRTGESLVIADAEHDSRFANDPYVALHKPKSILCVPILHQGKLIGILYLENNLITDAFTPDRIQVVQILSSQAAISLENAGLYDEMKQEAAQRKRAEETMRAITEGTASVTGSDFFRSLVRHLASAMQVRYAFIAECMDATNTRVRTLAFWNGEDFGEDFTYLLTDTPCEHVIGGEECYYPEHLQLLFPKDQDLVNLGAESYLGVPLHDLSGNILGHLAVMDNKPMHAKPHDVSILQIFAARVGAELERKRAEEALREALAEVEQLKNRLQAENVYLQEEIKTEHNFEEIIGASIAIKKVFQNIEKVARTDTTVLITGETGTGKELVARAIHNLSSRKGSALIKVNCAALPSGLIESELFGHEKGAFTGAVARKKGRFELADGGTIFLDEVGELPLETQVKLLRVLQEQEFERVGGSQTFKVDVRVIAATNRKLEEAVKLGAFRADLFYRLHIFPILLPALRERRDDIPLLANYFVGKFSRRMGKKIDRVSRKALETLMAYHWPGNVREMANILERAVILCDGGILQEEHIGIAEQVSISETGVSTLEEAERLHILKTLEKTKWIVGGPFGAAKLLGLK